MRCPRCACPGALIVGAVVRCVNRRCRWFCRPSHDKWRDALSRGDPEFSGDPTIETHRHLWEINRVEREEEDRRRREASDDA